MKHNSSEWLWAPPEPVGIGVIGSDRKFPVQRVFCVGRNYEAHAREMNAEVDREQPFYFTKNPLSIVASGSVIDYPPGTEDFHHEFELVMAIGANGFRVAEHDAPAIVFGYACGLDLTRRDLQARAKDGRKPWDISKDFEQAAVISEIKPCLAGDPLPAGRLELRVNDEQRQDASLSQLIWKIPEIIAHLSRYYHLGPGDLIFTGTPAGVGPLLPGDRLAGSIDNVGHLEATIGPKS